MGLIAAMARTAAASTTAPQPVAAPPADDGPLACIAAGGPGAARRRREDRLAAVLSEFGFRTHVVEGDDGPVLDADRLTALARAALVVCDVVRPDRDLPADLAVAATRGIPVVVLVPEEVPVAGLARELLDDCRATIVRYARVEPHRALHARLLANGI